MRHFLPIRLPAPGGPHSPAVGGLCLVVLAVGLMSLALPAMGQDAGDNPLDNPLDEPLLPPFESASPISAPAAPMLADGGTARIAAAEDPLDGEIRVRLLKMPGRAVLRTSSRKVAGIWEIQQGGRWVPLPDGMIESARLEHRVVREMHERRKAVERGDTDGLLDLARWEFDEGLSQEGLKVLDGILEDEPDHVGALLLLARPGLPFGFPRSNEDASIARQDLLDYGGQTSRAMQELVIRRLSQGDDQAVLEEDLARRLRSPRPRDREFAALACRRMFPDGIALKELLRRTMLDPYREVRVSAALALRDTGEEGLVLPLIRALESQSSVLRTHAARSLGHMSFAVAVEPLALRLATLRSSGGGDGWRAPASNVFIGRQVSFVQGFDTEIATGAAIAKPIIGIAQEGATLDVRVQGISGSSSAAGGLSYSYATETKALRHALARITGADVRDTNTAWREWWETYGSDWVAKHLADRPVEGGSLVGGTMSTNDR